MHIKPNDLTNNVFLRVKGWREMMLETEARLFPDADSDAMPHFKQTMFPLVNFAHPPMASAVIHFARAERVPTDGRRLQDGKPAADVFLTIKFSNLTRCKGRGNATRGQYPKQGIMNKRGFSEQPCTKGALSPPPQSIPSKMTNAAQDTRSSKPFWRISRRALLNAPCRLSPCVSPS